MSGEAPNPHLSSASQWSSSSPRVLGGSPKPRYFICRPDNTLTPLIALDELHPSVRIAGIPRTLMPNETASMVSLGVQERSLGYFYVETIIDSGSSSIKKPEKDIVNTAAVPVRNGHDGARDDDGSGKVEEWRQGISSLNQTQASIEATLASDQPAEKDRPLDEKDVPLRRGKVFCTHWIRTGECDFIQQGCLYKHEMPDDKTLKAIGFASVPPWYLKSHPERRRSFSSANPAREKGQQRSEAPRQVTSSTPSRLPPQSGSQGLPNRHLSSSQAHSPSPLYPTHLQTKKPSRQSVSPLQEIQRDPASVEPAVAAHLKPWQHDIRVQQKIQPLQTMQLQPHQSTSNNYDDRELRQPGSPMITKMTKEPIRSAVRQPSPSSDLFALAPRVSPPPHRRLFVSPGEERFVKSPGDEKPRRRREAAGEQLEAKSANPVSARSTKHGKQRERQEPDLEDGENLKAKGSETHGRFEASLLDL